MENVVSEKDMKYKVVSQLEERDFYLKDENGNVFVVDFFTDGEIKHPEGAGATEESWNKWFQSFIGKTLEIDEISPYKYFSCGKIKIID